MTVQNPGSSWPFTRRQTVAWFVSVIIGVVIGTTFGPLYGVIAIVAIGAIWQIPAQLSKRREV